LWISTQFYIGSVLYWSSITKMMSMKNIETQKELLVCTLHHKNCLIHLDWLATEAGISKNLSNKIYRKHQVETNWYSVFHILLYFCTFLKHDLLRRWNKTRLLSDCIVQSWKKWKVNVKGLKLEEENHFLRTFGANELKRIL